MPYIATITIEKETTEYKSTTVEEVAHVKIRSTTLTEVVDNVRGHLNMIDPGPAKVATKYNAG